MVACGYVNHTHTLPSDVSSDEWMFVAPYLALLPEDVSQRKHDLRDVFNGLRSLVKTGVYCRMLPHDLPPWPVAECFEAIVHDLRVLVRCVAERITQPNAAMLDSAPSNRPPRAGHAGYDGHKRRTGPRGAKVRYAAAVDTLGHPLALMVTPANEPDRAQGAELAAALQAATGETVEQASVDHGDSGDSGDSGDKSAATAHVHGLELAVVKLPEAHGPKRGFV